MNIDEEITLARQFQIAGKKRKARETLRRVLSVDKYNETAWILFSEVADTKAHEEQCLKTVLKINPQNEVAKIRINELQAQPIRRFSFSKWLSIVVIVIIPIICICGGVMGLYEFRDTLFPPAAPAVTATSVPVIINALSLLGLTPEAVKNLGFQTDNIVSNIPIGADNQFPNGGFYISFFINGSNSTSFILYFTPQRISKAFDVEDDPQILLSDRLQLQDWSIIGRMFGVALDVPPDIIHTNQLTGKDFSYEWSNWHGYWVHMNHVLGSDFAYYISVCRIDVDSNGCPSL